MDGDVAPLIDLFELARRHGCRLMVDEAHGTGAIGPGGRGAVAAAGLSGEVDVVVGTLGKALGSYGAYVCADAELIELLVNMARPFIFSTAPPPPSVGAAIAALSLLSARPGIVEQLRRNAATLREALAAHGLEVGRSRTQIIPVIVGDASRAMSLCERSLDRGVFAQAIRPPTVPRGQLAAAADGDGEPPQRGAPRRGPGDRPCGRRARDRQRGRRSRPGAAAGRRRLIAPERRSR